MPSSRGSPQPRDRTQISCIGRQILYHQATWEALSLTKVKQSNKGNKKMAFHFLHDWDIKTTCAFLPEFHVNFTITTLCNH